MSRNLRYRQLLRFVTPHRNTLLLIVLLLLAGTALNLANPLIAGKLTEVILAEPGSPQVSAGLILLAWFLLLAGRALISVLTNYRVGSTGVQMSAELRSRVYEHMQLLPLA